jgi:hypothetical protein
MPRRVPIVTILLAAVVARLAVMAPELGRSPADPDNYLAIARSVARGEGYRLDGRPTAYRPPLYPLVLAPIVGALGDRIEWGIAGLHLLLGVGTVAFTSAVARRWGFPPGRAAVAAAIVALDPVLVAQARSVMTETLSAFLVAGSLWALADPRPLGSAVMGGLGLGLSALCRPSLLPVVGLCGVAITAQGSGPLRRRLARAGVLAATTVLVLTPWAARNALVFGEPVWTTTHGGYTLALANNPVYYDEILNGPPGAVWGGAAQGAWWKGLNRATAGLPEPQADRILRSSAVRTIGEHPRDFLRASAARIGRFWGIAPSIRVYPAALRLATAMWTVPLWLALAIGLGRRGLWRWPCVAAPALLVTLTVVHVAYWSDMRMRAPIVPAIALIAAGAGLSPAPPPRRAGA